MSQTNIAVPKCPTCGGVRKGYRFNKCHNTGNCTFKPIIGYEENPRTHVKDIPVYGPDVEQTTEFCQESIYAACEACGTSERIGVGCVQINKDGEDKK